MYKFSINGSNVISKNDGDVRFIEPKEIANLYHIEETNYTCNQRGINYETIYLRPDPLGKYNLVDEVVAQINQRIIPKTINKVRREVEGMNFTQRLKFLFTSKL